MNEQMIIQKIKQHLNFGTRRLDRSTLTRLQKARGEALSRLQARETAGSFSWAHPEPGRGAGHGAGWLGQAPHFGMWLPLTVLLLGLMMAVTYWQHQEENGDAEEIDTLLLADELPVNAYIDKRFEAWLKHSQE